MSARVLLALGAWLLASAAHAQAPDALPEGHPSVDPNEALPEGHPDALPEGHPSVEANEALPEEGHPEADEALPQGHPTVDAPHGDLASVLRPPNVAQASASPAVPIGAIRVTVVDQNGNPVAGSPVDVGVLAQGGDRERRNGRTDQNGVAFIRSLPTGTGQAYRVNVPFSGAVYSSTPFQLPVDQGYDVRITRLPITRDDRFVFFRIFQAILELRDERLHVTLQAQLTNAGRATYVFPTRGRHVSLPPGAAMFQAQRVMTDQRVEEVPGGGAYTLRGSIPPGTVELVWAFQLPVDDSEMRVPIEVPVHFFQMRVIMEEAHDMSFSVSGRARAQQPSQRRVVLPAPERIEEQGGAYWVTGLQRGPTDPEIPQVTAVVRGIPRPGPLRWIAVVFAILFVVAGGFFATFRADDRQAAAQTRRRRRAMLLAEAEEIEKEHAAGEIGPQFRQKRRAQIVRELAALLHEEQAAKNAGRPAR